jgi:hypothetical protein
VALLTARLEIRHADGWWLIVAHDPATASTVVLGKERLARDAQTAAHGAARWLPIHVHDHLQEINP